MAERITPEPIQEPVSVDDNSSSLTVDGTVTANLSATDNAVLDAIEADTTTLAGAVSGTEMQVDVLTSALPSGAATAANQATIVGHVDGIEGLLTTIDADTSNLSVVGGGTEATAIRVTVASDSTGVLSIDDNGGSITVDGTVTADTELPAAAALADNTGTPTAPATGAFGMLYDGANWDMARGTSADGALVNLGANNDVTVTGTVTNTPSGDHTVIGKAADGAAVSGNPVLIAGQDGTNVQSIHTDTSGDLQVDVLTMPSTTVTATDLDIRNLTSTDVVTAVGNAAHASPTSGNPVYVAGRASSAIPTDVGADGDAAGLWTNRSGASVITMAPHVGLNSDPWNLVHETAQYTTTQTSTVLVTGGASEKIVVTQVQIQVGGTTAGTLQLYFGTAAYSRGTSRAIFDGEFAPSATLKPGVVMTGPWIAGTNGDDLMVTDSAAINPLTITVWYYVVT